MNFAVSAFGRVTFQVFSCMILLQGSRSMDKITVGRFIAEQRKLHSLTRKQLAEMLNVTDKAVSKWDTGKCYPDIETPENISVVFDCSRKYGV